MACHHTDYIHGECFSGVGQMAAGLAGAGQRWATVEATDKIRTGGRRGGWGIYWKPGNPRSQRGPVMGSGQAAQSAEVYAGAQLLTTTRARVAPITD